MKGIIKRGAEFYTLHEFIELNTEYVQIKGTDTVLKKSDVVAFSVGLDLQDMSDRLDNQLASETSETLKSFVSDMVLVNTDRPFLMSKYQVTFDQYDLFCTETKRELVNDQGWGRGKRPVINVSWYDAIAFCNWRSTYEGLNPCYTIHEDKTVTCDWAANGYRLPTDYEFEYAYTLGKTFNLQLDDIAWHGNNSEGKTHPVGEKEPNELGIYDMLGNVWEWCWWKEDDKCLLMGGSWFADPEYCHPANRRLQYPNCRLNSHGFRVVKNG